MDYSKLTLEELSDKKKELEEKFQKLTNLLEKIATEMDNLSFQNSQLREEVERRQSNG